MPVTDEEYFYGRAEAELRMAQAARDPAAVRAHYILAAHYLDRVYGSGDHQSTPGDQIRARLSMPFVHQ